MSFAYDGKQTALDGVSLTVQAGERLAILGANGSGKSTLLKLLDGLYFPSRGVDLRLWTAAERRRPCGMMPPTSPSAGGWVWCFKTRTCSYFRPRCWDEIAFAPLQLGLAREEVLERVEAAMQALRIEKLRDRAPHRLSGGEKRRVALASVLTLRPEVWLLDEPTTGLDPRSQSWLVDFILEQRDQGKTVITATHDLDVAEEIASGSSSSTKTITSPPPGAPEEILCDHDLLHRCNLVHDHRHRHPDSGPEHTHALSHLPLHAHDHEHNHEQEH